MLLILSFSTNQKEIKGECLELESQKPGTEKFQYTIMALSETIYETVRNIMVDIKVLEESSFPQCTIYKVPYNLRKVNEEAYTPQLISIGPIHLNKPELKPMQEHKKRYFHFFWERVNNEQAMNNYILYLENEEQEIRKCYAEKFPDMSKEMLVETVLLDAVFIMELLLRNSSRKLSDTSKQEHDYVQTKSFKRRHSDDYILRQAWLSKSITRDLILLENQVPFFVLMKLYDTVVPDDNKKRRDVGKNSSPTSTREETNNRVGFTELAFNYFEDYYPHKSSQKILERIQIQNYKSCKHFTDLIRYTYLPGEIQEKGVNPSQNFTSCPAEYVPRTATKLNEAGISFERVQGRSFLDIRFESTPILSWFLCLGCLRFTRCLKARLQIPQLRVDQVTECVLRNLIALEQCHYSDQPFICNYVFLIDSLIHTKEDVELLVYKDIIVHELGSHKELATLVNGLCRNVVVTSKSSYFGKTIVELNEHYNSCWKRYMGMLRSVYFRDPWRLSSTVVGVAVFLFAVVNFLRVIGVLHPRGVFV